MTIQNPLLEKTSLPNFQTIQLEDLQPAVESALQQHQKALQEILDQTPNNFTWDSLIPQLEMINDDLDNVWSVVNHLNAVNNSPSLRKIYSSCLPLVTEYFSELGLNTHLYKAIEQVATNKEVKQLRPEQRKILANELRDFRLAGVDLGAKEKKQLLRLQQRLSKLCNKFANNVLDATQHWSICLTKSEITGIPENALKTAKAAATKKNKPGWLFTLDYPSYAAVITYAESRQLRQEIYTAFSTIASDQGPNANKWDNSKIITEILQTRQQIATLVYFNNYAEFSLVTKMAKQPQKVLDFIANLVSQTTPAAKHELQELSEFAMAQDDVHRLQPWDIAYYSEKLRQHKYTISQEELRPYFPIDHVLNGMFEITSRLFGITVKEATKQVTTWYPEVRFFEAYNLNKQLIGGFYLDLYTRPSKRSGAWMDNCRNRRNLENNIPLSKLADSEKLINPIAYIICNFNPANADEPAILTHNDVETLFHEFGHCLQHIATTVDYPSIAGINGIPWDAVELCSQFMEYWCWDETVLKLISQHYQTKEVLPDTLIQQLRKAKNFQAGLGMLRQLELSLFDLRIHLEFDTQKPNQVQKILNEIRSQISVLPVATFNRMQNSFLHIFAGSYAAGYYSYKWAEVLAADAFTNFQENGLFNKEIGRAFLHTFLEQGGAIDPLELFQKFCGREPDSTSLLKQCGIEV